MEFIFHFSLCLPHSLIHKAEKLLKLNLWASVWNNKVSSSVWKVTRESREWMSTSMSPFSQAGFQVAWWHLVISQKRRARIMRKGRDSAKSHYALRRRWGRQAKAVRRNLIQWKMKGGRRYNGSLINYFMHRGLRVQPENKKEKSVCFT